MMVPGPLCGRRPAGRNAPPSCTGVHAGRFFYALTELSPPSPRPSPGGGRVRRVQHTPSGGADPRHGRGRKNLDGASPVQVNKTSIYFVDLIQCFDPGMILLLLSLRGATMVSSRPFLRLELLMCVQLNLLGAGLSMRQAYIFASLGHTKVPLWIWR